jgi:hypothetical protein
VIPPLHDHAQQSGQVKTFCALPSKMLRERKCEKDVENLTNWKAFPRKINVGGFLPPGENVIAAASSLSLSMSISLLRCVK